MIAHAASDILKSLFNFCGLFFQLLTSGGVLVL